AYFILPLSWKLKRMAGILLFVVQLSPSPPVAPRRRIRGKIMRLPVTPFLARLSRIAALAGLCLLCGGVHAMETIADIEYARVGDRALLLDLYLPDGVENPPLVLWVHGGAWRFGGKADPLLLGIVDEGFALASIDFRNSPEAPFPAQVHDIKAAVRFLRARAAESG